MSLSGKMTAKAGFFEFFLQISTFKAKIFDFSQSLNETLYPTRGRSRRFFTRELKEVEGLRGHSPPPHLLFPTREKSSSLPFSWMKYYCYFCFNNFCYTILGCEQGIVNIFVFLNTKSL